MDAVGLPAFMNTGGDTTVYGGASSSGAQPMDQSVGQQKRSELGDTGGEETKKRGRKKRGDEVVLVESGNGNGRAKEKAKTKAKREQKETQQLTQPETDVPASKPPKNIPSVSMN